jgi:hypothetical protein
MLFCNAYKEVFPGSHEIKNISTHISRIPNAFSWGQFW